VFTICHHSCFIFMFLFGVDGQLAQVSRMDFYFGRCSRWVHGIVGRACGLSLVFPYPSALVPPVLRLFVWGGACALGVGRDVCFGFLLWGRGCVAMFCW